MCIHHGLGEQMNLYYRITFLGCGPTGKLWYSFCSPKGILRGNQSGAITRLRPRVKEYSAYSGKIHNPLYLQFLSF